jgi:TonB-dependent receptor
MSMPHHLVRRSLSAATSISTGRSGARALIASVSLLALAQTAHAADAAAASADSNGSVSEVVVTAPRSETKAREVQFQAPNLISVQSAETMAKYPDFNAAESLGRMPGISLSTDTGEGRFINIRGIDGNLDGATFGGVPQLNTYPGGTYFSGGGRAVEFDTIPEGAIDGLIVTYTGLPDHEAEGLGGSVELTPRTAAHISQPFLEASAGGGYEPEHGHDGPYAFDLAVGARFGFDDGHFLVQGMGQEPAPRVGFFSNPTPFSFVLTASSRTDRRGFDDIEEDYNNAGTSDRSYQDLQFRRYDYHRRRFGFGGEFDFTPNEDHNYYLRANVAGYTESVKKNRLTWSFGDPTPDGTGYDATAKMSVNSTDEEETHRNEVFVGGGQDRWGDVVLDYRASYSTASYDQNRNIGSKFKGPTVMATYNNSGDNGDFPQVSVTNGVDINNPALYTLSSVSDGAEHDLDQEYAFAGNLLFPVHLINDQDRIRVGFEARLRDKVQRVFENDGLPGGDGSIDLGSLSLDGLSSPAITNFYDNGYSNGPNVNTLQLRSLVEAAQGPLVFDPTAYFRAHEDIYAGYGEYTATVGKFGLLAGVRVEATDAEYSNYEFISDGTSKFLNNPQDYVNAFPTVQLRYDFTPTMVLRATYSTGIGRPGFNQVAGAVTVDQSNGIITTGNPNLKPTTGNNFDLDFEYYLPKGGILQLGAFDKEFSNYIVTRNSYAASDPRIPGYSSPIQYVTFANVASAYARGVEASYHQQFLWLPDPLNGLGVESNVTLVDSRFQEYDAATSSTGHAEYGLLPGTSRVTANFAGFYEAHNIQVRLSGEYVGPELFSLGGSKQTDTIQDARLTLDFASGYKINGNWSVYFNAKNLLNTPLRFYMGNSSFPIQREFYDVTYEAGIRAKF